jgi:hypothetical protein
MNHSKKAKINQKIYIKRPSRCSANIWYERYIWEDTVGKKIIKRGSNRKDRRMIFKEEGMDSME